jgi:hypothetical protein
MHVNVWMNLRRASIDVAIVSMTIVLRTIEYNA